MSDELPKKVFSVPPPPTDEIDSEWGGKGADESTKTAPLTATEAAEAGKAPLPDVPPGPAAAKLKQELAGQNEAPASPGTPPPPSHHDEEEEDDEDDEDDEDEDDQIAHAGHAPVTRAAAAGNDWLPDWAPFAVLGALVVLGVLGGLGAFTTPGEREGGEAVNAEAKTGAAQAEAAVPTSVEASHFLVMYKGSMRAPEGITRTKEEAKARAEEGLAKVKKGADFAKIVGEYSDEPGAGARGGALGEFTAARMVKPFSDAAFKLKVGQLSGLVETPFGYHVIKRTK